MVYLASGTLVGTLSWTLPAVSAAVAVGTTYAELIVNFVVCTGVLPPAGQEDLFPLQSTNFLERPRTFRQITHSLVDCIRQLERLYALQKDEVHFSWGTLQAARDNLLTCKYFGWFAHWTDGVLCYSAVGMRCVQRLSEWNAADAVSRDGKKRPQAARNTLQQKVQLLMCHSRANKRRRHHHSEDLHCSRSNNRCWQRATRCSPNWKHHVLKQALQLLVTGAAGTSAQRAVFVALKRKLGQIPVVTGH